MSIVSRATLKSYFMTGDVPTQSQYQDFIDTCLVASENTTINDGVKLISATNANTFIRFGDLSGLGKMIIQGSSGQMLIDSTGSFNITPNVGGYFFVNSTDGIVLIDQVGITLQSPVNALESGDTQISGGNLIMVTAGKGLQINEETNGRMGVGTLVAGTKTVANTSITANTRIIAFTNNPGGVPSFLQNASRIPGTSFTITSGLSTDTSAFIYLLLEPAP